MLADKAVTDAPAAAAISAMAARDAPAALPVEVAESAAVTTAAGSEDLRRCCDCAPGKGKVTQWVQHRAIMNECCSTGWETVDALQKLLCAKNVHTQHKALKSYIGRNPQLRASEAAGRC